MQGCESIVIIPLCWPRKGFVIFLLKHVCKSLLPLQEYVAYLDKDGKVCCVSLGPQSHSQTVPGGFAEGKPERGREGGATCAATSRDCKTWFVKFPREALAKSLTVRIPAEKT